MSAIPTPAGENAAAPNNRGGGMRADLIEVAMNEYWFSPRVSWTEWPRCADYIAARLDGRIGPPRRLSGAALGRAAPTTPEAE